MDVKVIRTEDDYEKAISRIDELIDAVRNTPEGEELDVLSLLVRAYESEKHPIDPPDPIEAIKFRMEQYRLKQKDLIQYIGSQSKVSEILNRKRSLSIKMIQKLHHGLGIPLESLMKVSKNNNKVE